MYRIINIMFNTPANDPDYFQKRSQQLLLSGFPMELLNIDFISDASTFIRWHWHDEIEIIYVQEGQAYVTCNEDTIYISKGDIFMITPNVKHFITPYDENNTFMISIIMHPSCLFGIGQLEMEKKYINPVIHSQSYKYLLISTKSAAYKHIHKHLKSIIEIFSKKDFGYELLAKSAMLQMWKYIFEYADDTIQHTFKQSKIVSQDEQRVKQAILFIHEHYMETITLDDISNSIMVSKSECCRCFKRTLNVSPFEYLMKYRILESTKRMSKKPHESISEIAGAVGFNNTSYYNKIFKKFMDCTPTEYRTSIKKHIK